MKKALLSALFWLSVCTIVSAQHINFDDLRSSGGPASTSREVAGMRDGVRNWMSMRTDALAERERRFNSPEETAKRNCSFRIDKCTDSCSPLKGRDWRACSDRCQSICNRF